MAFINSSRVRLRASESVRPRIIWVNSDPHAIAGTQPLARNRISVIVFSVTFAVSFKTSPHAGFSSCTDASGSVTSPAFRGCSK